VPWAPRSTVTVINQSTDYGYSYGCTPLFGLDKYPFNRRFLEGTFVNIEKGDFRVEQRAAASGCY
jgi:hypothetical protein